MAIKVILPVVGIFGSFAGAVLASNNNSRSAVRASTSPYHKWKAQPSKSIRIPFSCRSLDLMGFRDSSKYTFTVIVDIPDWKIDNSSDLEMVGFGDVRFEFVTDGSWSSSNSLIKSERKLSMGVYRMSTGKGIRIEFNNQGMGDLYKNAEFACSEDVSKFTVLNNLEGDGQIFFSQLSKSGDKKLVSLNEEKGQVKVNYDRTSCKVVDELGGDKTTAICDLELSDTLGNKWNAKLPKEAKFTFS